VAGVHVPVPVKHQRMEAPAVASVIVLLVGMVYVPVGSVKTGVAVTCPYADAVNQRSGRKKILLTLFMGWSP
jgi:hypothetical protein